MKSRALRKGTAKDDPYAYLQAQWDGLNERYGDRHENRVSENVFQFWFEIVCRDVDGAEVPVWDKHGGCIVNGVWLFIGRGP